MPVTKGPERSKTGFSLTQSWFRSGGNCRVAESEFCCGEELACCRTDQLRRRNCHTGLSLLLVCSVALAGLAGPAASTEPLLAAGDAEIAADPAAIEFFEKSVRPILAARCQGCHGSTKQKGGLRLDARAALIAGGLTGPAVVPGNPEESLLVDAINYGETYQMPPKSKLPDQEIATLTEWVKRGVPWGVDTRPVSVPLAATKPAGKSDKLSKEEFKARAHHWSFHSIGHVTPPAVRAGRRDWARNPIDRFIQATLAEHGLSPAPEADRRTLIRRLSFDLTGLPPAQEDVAVFLADPNPDAYERLVDRLLASPRHGERWARHWLDLVRYAETAGHEFDYDIVNASRYRDYVIRAFNSDLAYNRFVTEQIAGDLLEPPRRHPAEGFNESILGTGFYFLGEGTHSPVDVREEQMRRIDNQIDVLSKTFLGLTVACARCHDTPEANALQAERAMLHLAAALLRLEAKEMPRGLALSLAERKACCPPTMMCGSWPAALPATAAQPGC